MSKKRKNPIPKRIVGVKVPKKIRKGEFGKVLASKTGQALIAEAVMAVGALAAAKHDTPKARRALSSAKDSVADAGHDVGASASALTFALGEAVRSFADALRQGSRDRSPEPPASAEAEPDAKKNLAAHPPLDMTPA